MRFEEVDRGHLTPKELDAFASTSMPSEHLELVRDLFVFCCYTGLSYIDLKNLTWDNIVKDSNGNYWIDTRRAKTNIPVVVRLLDIPLAIIRKYTDHSLGGPVFCVPDNQTINYALSDIAVLCGIHKHVTFHTARHTFATTVTLSNGVPLETVSKMLGHKNIRTTQIYARITKNKIDEDMETLARKLNKAPTYMLGM